MTLKKVVISIRLLIDGPIYIHEGYKEWVTRLSDHIIFWSGEELILQEGIVLHRAGVPQLF